MEMPWWSWCLWFGGWAALISCALDGLEPPPYMLDDR